MRLIYYYIYIKLNMQVMWIMDKVFKFTNFGIVSWIHDDFFILAVSSSLDKINRIMSKCY